MAVFPGKLRPRNPYLEPVVNTPYFAARQERQDRQLNLLAAGKLWRSIALVALIANITLASAMVAMAQMRKETPFVIAVDKWGYTVPVGRAEAASVETYVHYHLKEFIRLARGVTIDTFALEGNIKRAYAFVKKPSSAFNFLQQFYTEVQKPFERAKQLSVYAEDISIVRVSAFTFRARWSEVTRAMSGHELSRDRYWGEFTYRIYPAEKQDASERDANPLVMKIEQINWAKE